VIPPGEVRNKRHFRSSIDGTRAIDYAAPSPSVGGRQSVVNGVAFAKTSFHLAMVGNDLAGDTNLHGLATQSLTERKILFKQRKVIHWSNPLDVRFCPTLSDLRREGAHDFISYTP
jgi:hypothetical protein